MTPRYDDIARLVITTDPDGTRHERPYTPEEHADADRRIEDAAAATEAELAAAQARYETHEGILDATAALMESAHDDGAAWVAPEGAHNAYPLGRTVTHNGTTWESITPANVWEPGVSGWREVAVGGPVAWILPLGAHDAYPLGATVTHNEQTWESTVADNVWEPGVYGWEVV